MNKKKQNVSNSKQNRQSFGSSLSSTSSESKSSSSLSTFGSNNSTISSGNKAAFKNGDKDPTLAKIYNLKNMQTLQQEYKSVKKNTNAMSQTLKLVSYITIIGGLFYIFLLINPNIIDQPDETDGMGEEAMNQIGDTYTYFRENQTKNISLLEIVDICKSSNEKMFAFVKLNINMDPRICQAVFVDESTLFTSFACMTVVFEATRVELGK